MHTCLRGQIARLLLLACLTLGCSLSLNRFVLQFGSPYCVGCELGTLLVLVMLVLLAGSLTVHEVIPLLCLRLSILYEWASSVALGLAVKCDGCPSLAQGEEEIAVERGEVLGWQGTDGSGSCRVSCTGSPLPCSNESGRARASPVAPDRLMNGDNQC